MDKLCLRKEYIKIRNDVIGKDIKSKDITEKILELEEYKQARVVCMYLSLEAEVDTSLLIRHALTDEKVVGLPKVIDKDTIEFYKTTLVDELKVDGSFGIKEPIGDAVNLISKADIDLIIVPGVCFDKERNRVGFGKGYYDRYLADISKDVIKLGICFDEQLMKDSVIETTANDVKMDMVITDKTSAMSKCLNVLT